MKKILILGIVAVMLLTLIGGTVMAKGGNDTDDGDLQEDAIVHAWQSHGDVGGNDAGAIILASGRIGPKKKMDLGPFKGLVDTELSMAYTWGFYGHNKNALLYGYAQPGAPTTLTDTKTYTPHPYLTPFDITYTFTATDADGNVLVMNIVHGVVHEGPSNGIGGTTNEWLIGLEVNGEESTGTFAGESGIGLIRLVVDSNNIPDILGSKKYISAYEIYLKLGEVLIPPVE